MDIVVSGGSDPDRPVPAPRDSQHRLLQLIAVGVFLVAAGTGFTGWTVYEQTQDVRVVQCAYLSIGGREAGNYDDLEDFEQAIVDQLDCDMRGR
jgi:hypothetical protein